MAPSEAVELGGWRNNSLAADSAPRAALDALVDCRSMLPRRALSSSCPGHRSARGPRYGRGSLLHGKILEDEVMVLDDVNHGVE
jgi:hypothetical protein